MKKVYSLITAGFFLSTAPISFAQTPAADNAPAVSVLDQKDKELQAQEQLLLKQVGEFKSEAPAPAVEPQKAAPETKQLDKPAESVEEAPPPAAPKTKVSKTEKKAAEAPPQSVSGSSAELNVALARIKKLEAELDDARNRLMISETEVERLALLVDEQNRRTGKTVPAVQRAPSGQGLRVRDASEIQAKADSDMPIATVIAEKAQLRTGPGKDNSPLMTVAQGTRLAVETRNGDWYRVISPTGARAWVSSDVIDFGNVTNPESAIRGKGFSQDAEEAAFEALAKGTKSQR